MKKSQLITAMAFLTITGAAIVAAGLVSISHLSDSTISQAWSELWDQHTMFAWVMTLYCSIMMAFDLWVIVGAITQSSQQKDIIMSPAIKSASRQKEII